MWLLAPNLQMAACLHFATLSQLRSAAYFRLQSRQLMSLKLEGSVG